MYTVTPDDAVISILHSSCSTLCLWIHLHAVTPHLPSTTDQNVRKLVGVMQLTAAFAIINKYE